MVHTKIVVSSQEQLCLFYSTQSPFSNFYPSEFTSDDGELQFRCSEQYFMYQKALMVNDKLAAEEILWLTAPGRMKAVGRRLVMTSHDLKKWSVESVVAMKSAVLLKFSQNEEIREFLFRTTGMIIAEASQRDSIWGIGLSVDDKKAENRLNWKGQNRLGKILMEVRDELWENKNYRNERLKIEAESLSERIEKISKV